MPGSSAARCGGTLNAALLAQKCRPMPSTGTELPNDSDPFPMSGDAASTSYAASTPTARDEKHQRPRPRLVDAHEHAGPMNRWNAEAGGGAAPSAPPPALSALEAQDGHSASPTV